MQEDEAVPPLEENSTPTLSISLRQVYEAVTSFKAGSAAGPSGLRGEHLKEARGRGEGGGERSSGYCSADLAGQCHGGRRGSEVITYAVT